MRGLTLVLRDPRPSTPAPQVLRRTLHVYPAAHGAGQPAHQVGPGQALVAAMLARWQRPACRLRERQRSAASLRPSVHPARNPRTRGPPTCPPALLCCGPLQPDYGVDGAAQPDDGEPGHSVRGVARGRERHRALLLHQPLQVSPGTGPGRGARGLRPQEASKQGAPQRCWRAAVHWRSILLPAARSSLGSVPCPCSTNGGCS